MKTKQQLQLLYSVNGISPKIIAEQELVVMFKACNEGWVGDLEDSNQPKYFVWWKKVNGETQFDRVHFYSSFADTSLRLAFLRKEDALEAKDKFFDIYKLSRNT